MNELNWATYHDFLVVRMQTNYYNLNLICVLIAEFND